MITSLSNTRLKEIRKLRDRKNRTDSGLAWVEGLRACGDAFSKVNCIRLVVYCPETLRSEFGEDLLKKAVLSKIEIISISQTAFQSLSGKENPQGIGLVIQQEFLIIEEIRPQVSDIWVVLDRVADPGNLGTIMRTLDACGGKGVILVDQCTDPYDSTAIRASTGAIFHLGLIKVNCTNFGNWKKKTPMPMVGAVAVPGAVDYHTCTYGDPLLLLMGSEREGLQQELADLCDLKVSIPMVGHVDSLNLAEATAIVLYEIFNQRRGVNTYLEKNNDRSHSG